MKIVQRILQCTLILSITLLGLIPVTATSRQYTNYSASTALSVLQGAVGKTVFASAKERFDMDFNGNGIAEAVDALGILKTVVGKTQPPSSNDYVPEIIYEASCKLNRNFFSKLPYRGPASSDWVVGTAFTSYEHLLTFIATTPLADTPLTLDESIFNDKSVFAVWVGGDFSQEFVPEVVTVNNEHLLLTGSWNTPNTPLTANQVLFIAIPKLNKITQIDIQYSCAKQYNEPTVSYLYQIAHPNYNGFSFPDYYGHQLIKSAEEFETYFADNHFFFAEQFEQEDYDNWYKYALPHFEEYMMDGYYEQYVTFMTQTTCISNPVVRLETITANGEIYLDAYTPDDVGDTTGSYPSTYVVFIRIPRTDNMPDSYKVIW